MTITPALHHFGTTTTRPTEMAAWYRDVLGMELVFRTRAATFVTNDEHHHRGGFFTSRTLRDDPDRLTHARVQHLAWEYPSLEDLLTSWQRIAGLGIEPVACWCHGPSFAFYYRDPDDFVVELLADSYGDHARSRAHADLPEFRANPLGISVDPSKLRRALRTGASVDDLRRRSLAGEFRPAVEPSPAAAR